jgi:fibronectin-binding autotransporter adhesin
MKTTLRLRSFFSLFTILGSMGGAFGQSTWNLNTGGSWNTSSNWTGGIPDGDTATATLQRDFTSAPTLSLNNAAGFTVNRINYEDTGTSNDVALTIAAGTGAGKLTLAGTTPTINAVNNVTISAVVDGTTSLTKIGAGTLTLSGTNTYSGTTIINAGTLTVSGDHSGATGGWNIGSGAAGATFSAGSTISIGTGRNVVTANGGGTAQRTLTVASTVTSSSNSNLTLWGRNTLTINNGGTWTMQGGTLTIQPLNTTYSAILNVNAGGSFTYGGTSTIVLTRATSGNSGNGTINLSGTFTTSRGISNSGAGTGTGTTNFNFSAGGTLKISNDVGAIFTQGATPFNVSMGTGGGVIDTNGFTTATSVGIVGAGGLTKAGNGTLSLAGSNSYVGTTTVTGGTLSIGNGGATGVLTATTGISNNSNLTINRNNVFNQTTDLNNQAITGTGSLTQAGSGTTLLTAVNTYTGATIVNAGTLAVSGGSLANTAISVNNTGSTFAVRPGSGTLSLGSTGAGTAGASIVIASGAAFSMVDGDTGTALLQQQDGFASSALTISGGAVMNFDVSPSASDKLALTLGATVSGDNFINVMPTGPLGAGTYDLITAAGGLAGSFKFGGSGSANQTVAVGTTTYQLALSNTSTAVTLTVATGATITGVTWTGLANGTGDPISTWDNASSNNWAAGAAAVAFTNGTAVTFGDTNAANGGAPITNSNVVVATTGITPSSAVFTNSVVDYTVTGGAMSGAGSLTKTGSANVILANNSTYTGATIISAGSLQLGNGGTTGALTATSGITNDGNLTINRSNAFAQATDLADRVIAGTGSFTQAGSGTTTLTWNNTYTGATVISSGILRLGSGGSTGALSGTSGITNDGNLTINRNNAFTQAIDLNGKAISGLGSLTQAGTGTTTLTAANTYSGATTITAGRLMVSGGSLADTAINVSNAGSTFAVLPGAGTLHLGTTGDGTTGASLTMATGTVFSMVDGVTGTVNLRQQDGFFSSGLVINGATLNFDVSATTVDKLAVSLNALVFGNNLINVVATGSLGAGSYNLITAADGLTGNYNFGGSGTATQTVAIGSTTYDLALSSTATAVTLTVTAGAPITGVTWTGQTNGNGATNATWDHSLSTNWAANSAAVAFGNGTAVMFGDTNAANSDAPITSTNVAVASTGVTPSGTTFANSVVDYVVSGGAISGTGSLVKSGTAAVTLSNNNTYTGATTVNGGRLILGATGSIASSSALSIAAGARFETTAQASFTAAAAQPLTFGIDAAGSGAAGLITAADLNIANAQISYSITGTLDDPAYVLATYTGALTGTSTAVVPTPPTGYTLDFDYEGNKIALVRSAPAGFAGWQTTNDTNGGIDADHDNDGVPNGIEYFLGGATGNTTGFTLLPGIDDNSGVLSITWTLGTGYTGTYGTNFRVETSSTLQNPWTTESIGGNVTITGNQVKYTFPAGTRNFARLVVITP